MLRPRSGSGRPIPVVGHVCVDVDQAGDSRVLAQVDQFRVVGNGAPSGGHADDPVALDYDPSVVRHLAGAVDELAESYRRRLRLGRHLRGREENQGQRCEQL